MYNYFLDLDNNNDLEVDVITPTIGQQDTSKLIIKGRIIADRAKSIKEIQVIPFFDQSIGYKNDFFLDKELQTDLDLISKQQVYCFVVEFEATELETDFHFSVEAVFKNDNKTPLLAGFIQPVKKVEKVIFVVGSPRSGTSAMGKALRQSLKTNAHGESHTLQGFSHILNSCSDYFEESAAARNKGTLVKQLPRTVMIAEQISVLRRIYKLYYGEFTHLDKTPGIPMLNALKLGFMAWPNAKVIFCKRRAMENIASRLIKFPKSTFLVHSRQWKLSFISWRRNKKLLIRSLKSKQFYIEVDQYSMAKQPADVAERIKEFLGLSQHEANKLFKSLTLDRPQQTSEIDKPAKSLSDFGWSDQQIKILLQECEEEMNTQGYSFDQQYFKNINKEQEK